MEHSAQVCDTDSVWWTSFMKLLKKLYSIQMFFFVLTWYICHLMYSGQCSKAANSCFWTNLFLTHRCWLLNKEQNKEGLSSTLIWSDKKVAQVLRWEKSLWDVLLDKTIFEHDEESFLTRGTLINDTVPQLFYKSHKK